MDWENNEAVNKKLNDIRKLALNISSNAIIIIKSILAEKYYGIMEKLNADGLVLNVKEVEENLFNPPDEKHILKDENEVPNTFIYSLPIMLYGVNGDIVITKEDIISDSEKIEFLNSTFRMAFHIMNEILKSNEEFFSNNIPEYKPTPDLILSDEDTKAIMTQDEEEVNNTFNKIIEDARNMLKAERSSEEFKRKLKEEYERTIKAARYKYSECIDKK